MSERLDKTDLPRLRRMAVEHDWLALLDCVGTGPSRVLGIEYRVPALASREGQTEPVRQPGPWRASVVLARGMACQPLVQIAAADGYLPVSGNISGFGYGGSYRLGESDYEGRSRLGESGYGGDYRRMTLMAPGLVCYADRWDPTRLTLAWVVFQVARIIAGEVLNFEAQPLSKSGRDFQAWALAHGQLPTCDVSTPRSELLYLQPPTEPLAASEIEFHDR